MERCSRSERSGIMGLLVGVLQLKGIRRNTDKGGCLYAKCEEGVIYIYIHTQGVSRL